jgi:hypothetical protein
MTPAEHAANICGLWEPGSRLATISPVIAEIQAAIDAAVAAEREAIAAFVESRWVVPTSAFELAAEIRARGTEKH